MALGRFFLYIGQVDFVFGQVKFEDHLPGGRQFQNLNVEAWQFLYISSLIPLFFKRYQIENQSLTIDGRRVGTSNL